MRSNKRAGWRDLVVIAVVAPVLTLISAVGAFAQRSQYAPAPPLPPNQSQSGGKVLELPSSVHQGGSADTIPQIAPQTGQSLTLPSRQLRTQAGYEQVTVTVTDQQGRYVTGLQKDDFKLFAGFIHELNDRDDVFLFAFSSRPFLLQPFTTNHFLILSRLELLHAYGQTALYDTILDGLLMVEHGRYDKKALLVVTDGMDNTSQSSLEQVIAQARRMGVLVYSIGIGDPNSGTLPGLAIGPFIFGGDLDQVDARTLKLLSTETGAKTFLVREVGDGESAVSYGNNTRWASSLQTRRALVTGTSGSTCPRIPR